MILYLIGSYLFLLGLVWLFIYCARVLNDKWDEESQKMYDEHKNQGEQ